MSKNLTVAEHRNLTSELFNEISAKDSIVLRGLYHYENTEEITYSHCLEAIIVSMHQRYKELEKAVSEVSESPFTSAEG